MAGGVTSHSPTLSTGWLSSDIQWQRNRLFPSSAISFTFDPLRRNDPEQIPVVAQENWRTVKKILELKSKAYWRSQLVPGLILVAATRIMGVRLYSAQAHWYSIKISVSEADSINSNPDPGLCWVQTQFLNPVLRIWIRDLGSRAFFYLGIRNEHAGSYFRELRNSFLVKNTFNSFMRIRIRDFFDPGSGMEWVRIRGPMTDIIIPDPQHCLTSKTDVQAQE